MRPQRRLSFQPLSLYFKVQRPSVVCVWQRLMHAPGTVCGSAPFQLLPLLIYGRTAGRTLCGVESTSHIWTQSLGGDKKGTNKAPIHQATRLFNQPVAAQIKLIATHSLFLKAAACEFVLMCAVTKLVSTRPFPKLYSHGSFYSEISPRQSIFF